jgi:FkbM family methyltransferase
MSATDDCQTISIDLQYQLVEALNNLNQQMSSPSYKIIVSANEVNHNHGVGIFLHRLFPDTSDVYSIRSVDLYQGDHYFGSQEFCLHEKNASFHKVLSAVQSNLGQIRATGILLIPYYPADFLLGLALKRLYNCPLCVFVMDDQNIYAHSVEDYLVQQLLDVADLCFGISRPLCDAYQQKFHKKFWFFPPVIENKLIQQALPETPAIQQVPEPRGVLIGNIWSQRWLDQLCSLCRQTEVNVDWYGNPNRNWIDFDEGELETNNIYFRGFVEEEDLISALKLASFAIILTGSSDSADDRPELMKLSLPSRSCFMTATANIPLLVVGDKNSAIARFVDSAGLGVVCAYNETDFTQAVRYICLPDNQSRIRANSLVVGKQLGSDGLGKWLWDSLMIKRPLDLRFEKLWPEGTDKFNSVLVTASEINHRHGTGVLLKRVFPNESDIISVRTKDHYDGFQQWAGQNYCFSELGIDRSALFGHVASTFAKHPDVKRLFCVPYDSESLLASIAIKEFYGIPMAIWIMDDQNIVAHKIPDALMKEFLAKADVRFATHPEMRDAYETKFGFKFWLLPAVVPDRLISQTPKPLVTNHLEPCRGALVGSIWSLQWYNNICYSLDKSGVVLDWFGNTQYFWLSDSESELQQNGLFPQGLCPEDLLSEKLKDYPFVVVPTGTLDDRDDQPQLSKLSLPGRILFTLATANTPVILLGDPSTSAANFVKRFEIGVVCDYTPESVRQAVEYVSLAANQQKFRQNAASVAQRFSDLGIDEWIWQSLESGHAADDRFESLFQRSPVNKESFIEPPVPEIISKEYVPVYQVLRRLKLNRYIPDFVVDVGASHGNWSHTASQLYPDAMFILIDPLINHYEQAARSYFLTNIPIAKFLGIAVSNETGLLSFQASPDLHRSSSHTSADCRESETVSVAVKTLDQVAQDEKITGRGILRLHVQSAEHLILEGARYFLDQVDLVIAELAFVSNDQHATVFVQFVSLLHELGFHYYDETGEWRSPCDGSLLRKEVAFIRANLLVPLTSRKNH